MLTYNGLIQRQVNVAIMELKEEEKQGGFEIKEYQKILIVAETGKG